mmetsp:Transcript_52025/g.134918  ORF Transcript_52025/g.134918 Transcript_52025/m.134918 type:complete len:201 (+) Transcript_52025:273-875(+)
MRLSRAGSHSNSPSASTRVSAGTFISLSRCRASTARRGRRIRASTLSTSSSRRPHRRSPTTAARASLMERRIGSPPCASLSASSRCASSRHRTSRRWMSRRQASSPARPTPTATSTSRGLLGALPQWRSRAIPNGTMPSACSPSSRLMSSCTCCSSTKTPSRATTTSARSCCRCARSVHTRATSSTRGSSCRRPSSTGRR